MVRSTSRSPEEPMETPHRDPLVFQSLSNVLNLEPTATVYGNKTLYDPIRSVLFEYALFYMTTSFSKIHPDSLRMKYIATTIDQRS